MDATVLNAVRNAGLVTSDISSRSYVYSSFGRARQRPSRLFGFDRLEDERYQ